MPAATLANGLAPVDPASRTVEVDAFLLMICVQQEDTVHRLRKRRANGIFLTGSREHHVQEVLCITHVIARVDERPPLSVFVAHGR